MPGCIVPLCRCSATIFDISLILSCGRHRSLLGRDAGALGSSSIVWSQTVCSGSRCDWCSLNTLVCRWNALGTLERSASDEASSLLFGHFGLERQLVVGYDLSILVFNQCMVALLRTMGSPKLLYVRLDPIRRIVVWFLWRQFGHLGWYKIAVFCFCFLCHRRLVKFGGWVIVWWGV